MHIASRTPEGVPNRCPFCGHRVVVDPSVPPGDAPCPHCGQLLWFSEDARSQALREVTDVARLRDLAVVMFSRSSISGECTLSELSDELFALVHGPRKIVLDFTGVEHFSSAALGRLITLQNIATESSGHVRLCSLRPEIMEVIRITKLDRMFEIYHDQASALQGF